MIKKKIKEISHDDGKKLTILPPVDTIEKNEESPSPKRGQR